MNLAIVALVLHAFPLSDSPSGATTLPAAPATPAATVTTLEEALRIAGEKSPLLHGAQANAKAADARADAAFGALLPQVNASLGYQRSTFNATPQPGFADVDVVKPNLDTRDLWGGNISANQVVWDFGQTWSRSAAARNNADAAGANEKLVHQQVRASVRGAFFDALARQALLDVARRSLQNQERHLEQVDAFVEVGRRPEIDRAQIRADVASARVDVVDSETAYRTSLLVLARTMGDARPIAAVTGSIAPPLEEENAELAVLVEAASQARPELVQIQSQLEARSRAIDIARGSLLPTLGVAANARVNGTQLDALGPNAAVGATLSWPLFSGLSNIADIRAAEADLTALSAQRDAQRLQVHTEVAQTQLAVHAARESVRAIEDAIVNAEYRLTLAEARYETGAGSLLELSDAQLAVDRVRARKVQSDTNLSTARAQLLLALGRE